MKEINIEKVFELTDPIFFDVRSPIEYEESHIPWAINIPLFTNDERERIGTVYKQKGQNAARWLAMELVLPKVPSLLKRVKREIADGKKPVIYCWRGGMRSKSVATFADLAGIPVYRLTGGFKHYRQWVIAHLNAELLPKRFVVLHGMTGVGKTILLNILSKRGYPVLDLERCAGHRGSVFGGIGKQVNNQKTFEALLVNELQNFKDLPYVFIEAESKRIGKVVQPDFLLEAKRKGIHIHLETSLEVRVERIYEEYVDAFFDDSSFKKRVLEAITPISKRFPAPLKDEIIHYIEGENYKALISVLLTEYYDPRYQHKLTDYEGEFHYLNADNLERAADQILEIVLKKPSLATT